MGTSFFASMRCSFRVGSALVANSLMAGFIASLLACVKRASRLFVIAHHVLGEIAVEVAPLVVLEAIDFFLVLLIEQIGNVDAGGSRRLLEVGSEFHVIGHHSLRERLDGFVLGFAFGNLAEDDFVQAVDCGFLNERRVVERLTVVGGQTGDAEETDENR